MVAVNVIILHLNIFIKQHLNILKTIKRRSAKKGLWEVQSLYSLLLETEFMFVKAPKS